MTQEEKFLLLQDLCARLPYVVHCCVLNLDKTIKEGNDIIYGIVSDNIVTLKSNKDECYMYYQIKPYLRPMSSMIEEEKRELEKIIDGILGYNVKNYFHSEDDYNWNTLYNTEDWLNSHGFDYRGLIPKGLALEAPEGMYKIK